MGELADLQDLEPYLAGGDWSATALGPVSAWDTRLRTLADLVLRQPVPACLFWGPSGVMIFNKLWRRELGPMQAKVPGGSLQQVNDRALRAYSLTLSSGSGRACADFALALAPMMWRLRADGSGSGLSCIPVPGDGGSPGGVLCQAVQGQWDLARGGAGQRGRGEVLRRVSEVMRRLDDPAEIERECCRILGEGLDVAHACFVTIDEDAGVARVAHDHVRQGAQPLGGEYGLAAFARSIEVLRRGVCYVVFDAQNSPLVPDAARPAMEALGIASCIGAPLIRGGRLVGALLVAAAHPRDWSEEQTVLLREIAERVWSSIRPANTEADLRLNEERYRALVTASSNVVYRMSPDWREMRWLKGQGLLKDLPTPSADWIARYVDASDRPGLLAAIREAIRTRTMFDLEHRVKRLDGSTGWIHSRAVPLFDEAGEIVEWFGSACDVTEQREELDAVLRSEGRLRVAQAAAGVATFDWEIGSRTMSWSPEALDMLGFRPGGLGGTFEDWIATIHPDDLPHAREQIEWALEDGELEAEWRVRRADGEVIWVLVRGILERETHDRPRRLFGAQVDVTDRVCSVQDTLALMADLGAQINELRRRLARDGR